MSSIAGALFYMISLFAIVSTYDVQLKTGLVHRLCGYEIVTNGHNNYEKMYPLNKLVFNKAKENEILRFRFYIIGIDMYFILSSRERNPDNLRSGDSYYRVVINGYKGTASNIDYKTFSENFKNNIFNNTKGLTHGSYLTEFLLVITKDGMVELFEGNKSTPSASAKLPQQNNLGYIGFGSFVGEPPVRTYFDCAKDDDELEEVFYGTLH